MKSVPRVRRPRQRDSRSLIQAAARAEFAEYGFAGARVDRIARRAGVNKQLLFYYFGSKEELYQSIVGDLTGEAALPAAQAAKARHASEDLRAAFRSLFDSLARRPDLARMIMAELQRPGPAQNVYEQSISRYISEVKRVVVDGQGHGYFRDDVDPERAGQQALLLALGYVALERLFEKPADAEKARTWRDATADLLVRAFAW